MQRVLVTGSSGYVGSRFLQLCPPAIECISYEGDICDRVHMSDAIRAHAGGVVLHLASKTHIDTCEADCINGKKGKVWKTNVSAVRHIARVCQRYGVFLILLSTECVFDGEKGSYYEEDVPNPINWYGKTKRKGEEYMLESGVRGCILRAVLAYGHPRGYTHDVIVQIVRTLQRGKPVATVTDQQINPTYVDDLISVIGAVISHRPHGIIHYGGSIVYSPYDIAIMIADILRKPKHLVQGKTMKEYFGKNHHARLSKATLKSRVVESLLGCELSHFDKALSRIIRTFV